MAIVYYRREPDGRLGQDLHRRASITLKGSFPAPFCHPVWAQSWRGPVSCFQAQTSQDSQICRTNLVVYFPSPWNELWLWNAHTHPEKNRRQRPLPHACWSRSLLCSVFL